MRQQPVYRYTKTKKLLPVATFDIETDGMGGTFLDACIYYEGGYYHQKSMDEVLDFMLTHPKYRYYAHNGGGYDFTYLIEPLLDRLRTHQLEVESIITQGDSRIIGFILKNRKRERFEIRDSLAILPMSLEQAGKAFAPTLLKLTGAIDFEKETYSPDNALHVAYLHRDCESLFHIITNFEAKIAELFGCSIGFTSASTAVSAWKAHIPEGHCYFRNNGRVEAFSRRAYYGGYVYPGLSTLPHKDATAVDMNAAYAAAMRRGVPTGSAIFTGEYEPHKPGIYYVHVHVPKDTPFPFIPSRDARGNLTWCTGDFSSYVTSLEIEFAKEHGYTFEIIEGFYWNRIEYPFSEFLAACEEFETTDPTAKTAAKLLRNALYGKFGSRDENQKLLLVPDGITETMEPVIDEKTGMLNPYLTIGREKNTASYINPHWAAWITAIQRIELFKIFLAVGRAHVYYGDTDCCIGDSQVIARLISEGTLHVSNKYGDVKIERVFLSFQSLGPKNYHGILENGDYLGKAKGIPKRLLTKEKYLLYQETGILPTFEYQSVTSAYSKMKKPNTPICIKRTRTLSTLENSSAWNLKGYSIIPLHRTEIMVYT